MPFFGSTSRARLNGVHPHLVVLFKRIIEKYDCTVLCGVRTKEEQAKLFAAKKSRTLNSKHLVQEDGYSHAVDISPYPIPDNWGKGNEFERYKFYHFAGYVKSEADRMGVRIRWGGDWDGDFDFDDQTFNDLVHFELTY